MDAAVARFAAFGFTLTPRGHHSLGSINHLMVFEHDYLELIGLPRDGPVRREVAESPPGLNGLVFATDDATRLESALRAQAIGAQPPLAFDRPVEIDGATHRASFRTVRLDPGTVAGGRVYFCEHLTPGLVWRRPWQAHRNGVHALAGMTIVVRNPMAEAESYRKIAAAALTPAVPSSAVSAATASTPAPVPIARDDQDCALAFGSFTLRLTTLERYRADYGDFACDMKERDAFMGALALRTQSLDLVHACLDAASVSPPARVTPNRIILAARTAFNAVVEFEI